MARVQSVVFAVAVVAVLAGCDAKLGDVKSEDVSDVIKEDIATKQSTFNLQGIYEGMSPSEIENKLAQQGFKVSYQRPSANMITVVGYHGGTVNVLYTRLDFLKQLSASKGGSGNQFAYGEDKPDGLYFTLYGNNWARAGLHLKLASQGEVGASWKNVATTLKGNWGLDSFNGFPEQMDGGQKRISLKKGRSNATVDKDAYVSATIQSCRSPTQMDPAYGLPSGPRQMPSDVLYNQSVCEIDVDIMNNDIEAVRTKIWKELVARYEKQFGKPDCYDFQCDDDKKAKIKAIQSKINEKINS